MNTNESDPASPPRRLRWHQFSLRSMFVVITLFALGLGLYIQRENKIAAMQVQSQRMNYIDVVRAQHRGHDLWRNNSVLTGLNFICDGGGRTESDNDSSHSTMDLCFRKRDAKILHEVVATTIEIYHQMDIFCDPQTLVISDSEALLASPEGWLKLKARWLPDDSRVTENVQVLRVEQDICFHAQHAPGEKQDFRKRLPRR